MKVFVVFSNYTIWAVTETRKEAEYAKSAIDKTWDGSDGSFAIHDICEIELGLDKLVRNGWFCKHNWIKTKFKNVAKCTICNQTKCFTYSKFKGLPKYASKVYYDNKNNHFVEISEYKKGVG